MSLFGNDLTEICIGTLTYEFMTPQTQFPGFISLFQMAFGCSATAKELCRVRVWLWPSVVQWVHVAGEVDGRRQWLPGESRLWPLEVYLIKPVEIDWVQCILIMVNDYHYHILSSTIILRGILWYIMHILDA